MINLPHIFFCGKAGAGKSYACKYLIDKYGFTPGKMACSLYGIAKQYFGMTEKNKDRNLLQYMGTDVGRTVNENIWVKRFIEDIEIVEKTAKGLYNKSINFCSDDIRFFNEYLALTNRGWVGIYLNVPDEVRIERLKGRDGDAQVSTLQHSSETALDEFKDNLIQLDASGSLETTYQRIEETLEYIRREV